MGVPHEALALERRALGRDGEATLGAAYRLLVDQWRRGDRDRDLALHLMFLAWYLCAEPPHLTGRSEAERPGADGSHQPLSGVFKETYDHLERRAPLDPEFDYVVSVMASMFPYCCDAADIDQWERVAQRHRETYERLEPDSLTPEDFEGRGFYGHYFAEMIREER